MANCKRCGRYVEYYSDLRDGVCERCQLLLEQNQLLQEQTYEQRRQRDWEEEKQAHQDDVRREEIAYNNALPKCKWCGKQYSFSPEANSYYEYCSKKCVLDDLGKDKFAAYSQTGLSWIQEEINKAFQSNIHKAIVLSEGFSQLFTPQQHLTIARALSQHRQHFITNKKLVELQQYHYGQAFSKGTLGQKIEMACSPWMNQLQLEGTSLTDLCFSSNIALDFILRIFAENGALSREYIAIFV